MEHRGEIRKATRPSQAGQADPLTPLPQGEKKGGTSAHGAWAKTKAETTPPDGAKKGRENMKSGH